MRFVSKQGALSIQQKKPVQDFGIFAGQMERVPELENHVRRLKAGFHMIADRNKVCDRLRSCDRDRRRSQKIEPCSI